MKGVVSVSNIAVIYYSATGHVHQLAESVANGAADAGADVRLRRVAELAPEETIRRQNAWHEHDLATAGSVKQAAVEDLEWADGFAFGTPTRYGLPSAQLKEFIDQTGRLWAAGQLADKVATSFTSAGNLHGGQESTLLALNNTFYHWGSLIVPPGYTHAVLYAAGGNPYGTSYPSGSDDGSVSREALTAAHYQGYRLAQYADRLVAPPAGSSTQDEQASPRRRGLAPYEPPQSASFAWQERHSSP
jgi:NAD(P)H dehydrogenase (quinone)